MITMGSSEAATALGLSPWGDPWDLVSRLRGWTTYSDRDTPAMARGRMMEPALLTRYAMDTGSAVRPGPSIDEAPIAGPEPWMHARPDGWRYRREPADDSQWDASYEPQLCLEVKTSRKLDPEHGWGPPGTDQVPAHYLIQ